MLRRFPLVGLVLMALTACAANQAPPQSAQSAGSAPVQSAAPVDFEKDRQAILAMTGTYDVTFHFEETVALAEGYELKPEKTSGGKEIVFVVEDTGTTIRLQHILAVGDMEDPIIVKHWRQDWVYEPASILTYAGHEKWAVKPIPADTRDGAWAQKVYQVDDSPRYAAVGRWSHENGVSTWESPVSWRPLPRRDATTRDDYHVIAAVNRHTITPWGWSHEQDNEKLVLDGGAPEALVREIGVNSYVKTDDFPRLATEDYWEETADYWAAVRDKWDRIEAEAALVKVDGKEPDNPLYIPLLELASGIAEGETSTESAIDDVEQIFAARVSTER